ncbi:antiviral reverse transcriptase Drt5 [Gluconobacter kondonii]|uniref:antiviral reverse transcriptase Drt5 n=1 Tax=Gluconobacter kondonii TaxID=941463 RepID=UPI0019808A58|nr:antiviral reverse transcriptase Drt5 [Gluconobacter kondonii]MBN3868281.1 hypothetical protein [Gluconobacter kondonii]
MSTKLFFDNDYYSTLFPMETCKFLINNGENQIREYIQRCLSKNHDDTSCQFLAQTRVYASKPKYHLRRTVKLDPVSEFFIYDLIYRNRSLFRKPFKEDKKHFGYRFEDGKALPASSSYKGFKQALTAYHAQYKHAFSFDVASYFNSIYHHDIVSWFANAGATEEDVNALGGFLRQCNSGRSIDCLPQGIYPAKMIGNDFLRFVEQNHALKSKAIVRFMDDFTLFSDDINELISDFHAIQNLLGQKGLSVNPNKSKFTDNTVKTIENEIDEVKAKLLNRRRIAEFFSYIDDLESANEALQLTDEELKYIRNLLKDEHLAEEDVELVLSVFREHTDEVKPHLLSFALSFPHLAKSIWSFCKNIDDYDFIGDLILQVTKHDMLQEYQLFWFAWILQDYLMDTKYAPAIISNLYKHPNSTIISKSKILEIPDNRYGLLEMRDDHLVAGRSDWLAWASAVGHRNLLAVSRNHKLEYFGNSSQINFLIKSILTQK